MSEAKPVTIDTFLGVNKSATETLLKLGEASNSVNWLITDDRKLQKQYGYIHINTPGGPVRGQWYGSLNGVDHFLYARGGHVYEHDLTTHADTDLGVISDSFPTMMWVTNNTVYIMDGTEFYSWQSGALQLVTGYSPTVFTAAPPTGGGTILEGINYLTGQKTMKFSADGTATVYQLPEYAVGSVDLVIVGGVAKTVTTDYAVNLVNGTVTFVSAPTTGVNNVVITWTKGDAASRAKITKNRYYGGSYYARHWLFGNPDHRNTRYCSGVTMAEASDPTYWPMFTDSDVGEYAITDIKTQYDKQIIFTTGDSSGASAWYSTSETITDPNTGIVTTLFPVNPINAKVGNVAPGQVQIITNEPFTIWKGVYRWESTYVMNEKNAKWMSQRIQQDIDNVDLSKAITWDWDDKGLYYLCVGKTIWVYNYRVNPTGEQPGAWYILQLPHEPTCFMTVEQQLYFGTTDGYIMKFDESLTTYDGVTIEADWEMGYNNFGADWITKFIQKAYVSILPLMQTHIDLYVSTDKRAAMRFVKTIAYSLSSFDTWDFSNFSFEMNYSPQPKLVRLREKKIDYLKLKVSNHGADSAVLLSITFPVRTGGEIKSR